MSDRPWITCHVLDTVAGKPGANIHVTLSCITAQDPASTALDKSWTAQTNADGRVTEWTAGEKGRSLEHVIQSCRDSVHVKGGDKVVWSLKFQTEAYYGKGKTFWPEVELRFATDLEEEHYHVPLLLGPWSYTTYRGS